MGKLDNLQPERVFKYFEDICNIPHGSKNVTQISKYLCDFARSHELDYYTDDAQNVVIKKPATSGYENAETVIIQGHMDMVCEKEDDCDIDFDTEGLRLLIDGDYVKADGTTLGGDDGIAVAMGLAILEDDSLEHPALEVVITTDEEIGLLGANALDMDKLNGKILINLDSEEEGHFLTSCAGGLTANCRIPLEYKNNKGAAYTITVKGLCGGHSGSEIHRELGNSNFIMGRVLGEISNTVSFELNNLYGGLKDNAIPRKTTAIITIDDNDSRSLCDKIYAINEELKREYKTSDPGIEVTISSSEDVSSVFSPNTKAKILSFLRLMPNGLQHYSMDIPGLVETSLNAGIMNCENDTFLVTFSVRSSVESRKHELVDRLKVLAALLDGSVEIEGEYPAWEYVKESKIRDIFLETYKELTGKEAIAEAIHAGLECGLFSGNIEGLDAIALGPDLWDIHTPKERLSISSTERTYNLVCEVLRKLK